MSTPTSAPKTVEQVYQKKSQLEHILLRPDSYVGSNESVTQAQWVFDRTAERFVHRPVTYVPGLYKIFDEILVNAADNKQRDRSMTRIDVDIDPAANSISVGNNGQGIPVVKHRDYDVYVPELIFGHLLTSSNYDDTERKVTGGRNGYGAKLANIFSRTFRVETRSAAEQKSYAQTFTDNMGTRHAPVIRTDRRKTDYTKITFEPDLAKFGMTSLQDDDIVDLLTKRVYDMAGVTDRSVRVFLNGTRLPVTHFQEYVDLFLISNEDNTDIDAAHDDDDDDDDGDDGDATHDATPAGAPPVAPATAAKPKPKPKPKPRVPRIYQRINDRWEVVLSLSDGQFEQVSFVNCICTTKGGQHVNYLTEQVTAFVVQEMNKRKDGMIVKPQHVRNHLRLFVNCLIENPAFDSQTKDTLTTRRSEFSHSRAGAADAVQLSEGTLRKFLKCGIQERLLTFLRARQTTALKRKDGQKRQRLTGIPKLEDANLAGTRKGGQCTLILTEGDSAKALAVSGLSIVGRDYYGVYPLRGKVLNVRDARDAQVGANPEIQNIVKIMGLKFGVAYESVDALRYGHLMIMADQDEDGSHIKGLIINLISWMWPSLMKLPGFLQEFITPIVKVSKGAHNTVSFYTYPEYERWRRETDGGRGWTIKYYKGLGTSTAQEAKAYFAELGKHVLNFGWEGSPSADAIDLAFNKKRADDRKQWLQQCKDDTFVDYSVNEMKYSSFVNDELILYSQGSTFRGIPSLLDGLKPSQRKILFSCFKRNLQKELKVAQLAGYVSEQSSYHHGEEALANAIVKMARNFVGSNNLNYLVPSGQFGTRLMGGKDAASPRYIFTRLSPITRALFHPDDDPLLTYYEEDGHTIEPRWYLPVIPTVLVNGASGIGTGWSTDVPNYRPQDIIDNVRRILEGDACASMTPWYRGFCGTIVPQTESRNTFWVYGKAELTEYGGGNGGCAGTTDADADTDMTARPSSDTKRTVGEVHVSELPVHVWTEKYRAFLETLLPETVVARPAAGAGAGATDTNDATKTKTKTPSPCGWITRFDQSHTESTVSFTLYLTPKGLRAIKPDVYGALNLTRQISTGNMHLFDADYVIRQYSSPQDILQAFVDVRLPYYETRRAHKQTVLRQELCRLQNRVDFVLGVVRGDLVVHNVKRAELVRTLQARGFALLGREAGTENDADIDDDTNADDRAARTTDLVRGYHYLLSLPLWSLTYEKVEDLCAQKARKEAELRAIQEMTARDLWLRDLAELETAIAAFEEEMAAEANDELRARALYRDSLGATGTPKPKAKAKPKPRKRKAAAAAERDAEGKRKDTRA